jgi:hypothetical protein
MGMKIGVLMPSPLISDGTIFIHGPFPTMDAKYGCCYGCFTCDSWVKRDEMEPHQHHDVTIWKAGPYPPTESDADILEDVLITRDLKKNKGEIQCR